MVCQHGETNKKRDCVCLDKYFYISMNVRNEYEYMVWVLNIHTYLNILLY